MQQGNSRNAGKKSRPSDGSCDSEQTPYRYQPPYARPGSGYSRPQYPESPSHSCHFRQAVGYDPADLAVLGLELVALVVLGSSCFPGAENPTFVAVHKNRPSLETCVEIVADGMADLQVDMGIGL